MKHDVIIVGASFAGLAVASKIESETDNSILLIDKKQVGEHRTSACGTSYKVVKELGCEESILQEFGSISISTPSIDRTIKLTHPYCTINYSKFCKALKEQGTATFIPAHATGVKNRKVITNRGSFEGKVLVDCSGWQATLASSIQRNFVDIKRLSFGLDTTVPLTGDELKFYINWNIIKQGVAWVFPVGEESRVGVGSYIGQSNILPNLKKFLKKFNLKPKKLTGNFFPSLLREPTVENLFLVGDAAGQNVPVTGEGIRNTLIYGQKCGQIIQKIVDNKMTREEGLNEYRDFVLKNKKQYFLLSKAQGMMINSPEWAINLSLRVISNKFIYNTLEKQYLKPLT